MRLSIRFAAGTLLAAVAVVAVAPPQAARADEPKRPAGFTAIFNGKDLDGWQGNIDMKQRATMPKEKQDDLLKLRTKTAHEHWTVKDGIIHCDGKGGVSLQTTKDYGNFELLVEWKIEKNGDSGIYLRGQPQVQIWDSDNSPGARGVDKNSGSGGLWNNPLPPEVANSKDNDAIRKAGQKIGKIPMKKADKPIGEWNTFRIIMKGEKVTVYLNGELVVDDKALASFKSFNDKLPEKGPIELQFHDDPLWFKNIYVKELP
jgi:3-keto-disaccharide hydrolase